MERWVSEMQTELQVVRSNAAAIGPPPVSPPAIVVLPQAECGLALEVWRAAHRLCIIEAWQAWWRELRAVGDADAGAASGFSVAAGDAIDVLCRLKINASPFDVLSLPELWSLLPRAARCGSA